MQAWGDVGGEFISRMAGAARAQAERKDKIMAKVLENETGHQMLKSARQLFYEKQMIQKNNQKSFLERNYNSKHGKNSPFKFPEAEQDRNKLLTAPPRVI